MPKAKFLEEFTGYILASRLVATGSELSVSQAKAILGSRPVGRYDSAVNWSKWSNHMLLNIFVNIGMNMASSSLSGKGVKCLQ